MLNKDQCKVVVKIRSKTVFIVKNQILKNINFIFEGIHHSKLFINLINNLFNVKFCNFQNGIRRTSVQHLNLLLMALFSFFKKPNHQRFEYKPRYWNPEKEDLDERVRRSKREDNDPNAMKSRISHGLRRSYNSSSRNKSGASKKSTLRLFVIIGILLLFSYYFLVVYLPKFEGFLR
jgi:hypothetical protein